jgi:hypothetical protein
MLSSLSIAATIIYDKLMEDGDSPDQLMSRLRDLDAALDDDRDWLSQMGRSVTEEVRREREDRIAAQEAAIENMAARLLRGRGFRVLPEIGNRYDTLLSDIDTDGYVYDRTDMELYDNEDGRFNLRVNQLHDREGPVGKVSVGTQFAASESSATLAIQDMVREAGARTKALAELRSDDLVVARRSEPIVDNAIKELLQDVSRAMIGQDPNEVIERLSKSLHMKPKSAPEREANVVRESLTCHPPVRRNVGSIVSDGPAHANLVMVGNTLFMYLQDHVRRGLDDPTVFRLDRFDTTVELKNGFRVAEDVSRYVVPKPTEAMRRWALVLGDVKKSANNLFIVRDEFVAEPLIKCTVGKITSSNEVIDVISYSNSTVKGDCGCPIVNDRGAIIGMHGFGNVTLNHAVMLKQSKPAPKTGEQDREGKPKNSNAGKKGPMKGKEVKAKFIVVDDLKERIEREGPVPFGGVHTNAFTVATAPRGGTPIYDGIRVKPGEVDCGREAARFNTHKHYTPEFREAFMEEIEKLDVSTHIVADIPDICSSRGYQRLLQKFKELDANASAGYPWQCIGEVNMSTTHLDMQVELKVRGNRTLLDLIKMVGHVFTDEGEPEDRCVLSGVQALIFHFYHWYGVHIRGAEPYPSDQIRYIVFGKKDFYKLTKLDKGVVRTIQACDWRLKLLWAYYFSEVNDLWAHDQEHYQVVSINLRQCDWALAMMPLINDSWGSTSFDLTGNDRDMPAFCIEAFFDKFLRRCLLSRNSDIDTVLKLFSLTTTKTEMVLGKNLIHKSDGLPSGMPNTIMVNTVVRFCSARAILRVKNWVDRARNLRTCGDDLMMSTDLEPQEWIDAVAEHTPWVEKLESRAPRGELAHFISLRTVIIYRDGIAHYRPAPLSLRKNVESFLSRKADELDNERIEGLMVHHAVNAVFLRQNSRTKEGFEAFELFHEMMRKAFSHYQDPNIDYDSFMYHLEDRYLQTLHHRQAGQVCEIGTCEHFAVACCGHLAVCAHHALYEGLSVWDDEEECAEFEHFFVEQTTCGRHVNLPRFHRPGNCQHCGGTRTAPIEESGADQVFEGVPGEQEGAVDTPSPAQGAHFCWECDVKKITTCCGHFLLCDDCADSHCGCCDGPPFPVEFGENLGGDEDELQRTTRHPFGSRECCHGGSIPPVPEPGPGGLGDDSE